MSFLPPARLISFGVAPCSAASCCFCTRCFLEFGGYQATGSKKSDFLISPISLPLIATIKVALKDNTLRLTWHQAG